MLDKKNISYVKAFANVLKLSDKVNGLGTRKNPYMKRRMEYLEKEINTQIERINNEENNDLLEIVYLFYDGYEYNGT